MNFDTSWPVCYRDESEMVVEYCATVITLPTCNITKNLDCSDSNSMKMKGKEKKALLIGDSPYQSRKQLPQFMII